MRYGMDYDRPYRGHAPETNWMGRSYRTPGEPRPRGYDAAFGAGYRPRHGGRDAEWSGPRGYDRPYRPLGRRYASSYDRGYREMGGTGRGRVLEDPWGPYGEFRQMQQRAGWVHDRPWPSHYFTDHGHHTGPY